MFAALLLLLGAFGLQSGNLDAGFSVTHQCAAPKASRRPLSAPPSGALSPHAHGTSASADAAASAALVATCFAPLESVPAKPAVTALLSSLRAGCACMGDVAAAVDDDATFSLRLDQWAALRLRLYLAWVRHGRSFLEFPVDHLERPVGREPAFRDAGALAVEYGVLLTPAAFVGAGAGYTARVRAGRACRLLAAAAGEGRLGAAGGAAAWDAGHTLKSIELASHSVSSRALSPLWREVARRAALLAAGGSLPELDSRSDDAEKEEGDVPGAGSSQLVFSPAHLDAAVRSISLYVASSRHVRARLTLHPVPPADAGRVPSAGSERDLQYSAYRYLPRDAPADARAAAARAKLHPAPAVNASQALLAVAHVYHYENTSAIPATGTAERWMVLARVPRKQHRKKHRGGGGLRRQLDEEDGRRVTSADDASALPVRGARYMVLGASDGAAAAASALPALAATRAFRHAVDVLPVAHNRFTGQFYHTLGELTTALLPLQGLLSAVDASGLDGGDSDGKSSVLLPSAWVHPLVEAAGLGRRDGVRLRAAPVAGSVSYARLLLTADPVPVNWPDAVALLGLRERIHAAVLGPGAPQDRLDYLRGGGGGSGDGDGGGAQRDIRRRARLLTATAGRRHRLGAACDERDSLQLPRWLEEAAAGDDLATEEGADGVATAGTDEGSGSDGSAQPSPSPPLGCPGVVPPGNDDSDAGHRRPRVVLIRRRRTRVITNWDALAAAVNATGADVVVFDDAAPLPRRDALALFASADAVVAAHGAGLTNLLACASGTAVLEVLAAGWKQANYLHLSAVLGLEYHRWVVPGGSQHQPEIAFPLGDVLAALCDALRTAVRACLQRRRR